MALKNTGPLTRQRLAKLSLSTTHESGELREKVKKLVHELKTNTVDSPHHCGWLHLRIRDLSLEECQAIAEALKVNTDNVTWLNIAPINISLDGLEYIVDSLKTNTRITEVVFCRPSDNDLFDEENDDNYLIPIPIQSLVEVLKVNTSIRELIIANSSITDDDVKTIVNGLKDNTTLTKFYLEENPNLTTKCANYLSELTKSNKTLKETRFEEMSTDDDDDDDQ